jgi:hypothetical protein
MTGDPTGTEMVGMTRIPSPLGSPLELRGHAGCADGQLRDDVVEREGKQESGSALAPLLDDRGTRW